MWCLIDWHIIIACIKQAKQIICGACDQWLEKLLRRQVRAYSERSDATYHLVLPRTAMPATLMSRTRATGKFEGGVVGRMMATLSCSTMNFVHVHARFCIECTELCMLVQASNGAAQRLLKLGVPLIHDAAPCSSNLVPAVCRSGTSTLPAGKVNARKNEAELQYFELQ